MTQPALNRLSQEKSPYLLQHAENPVDWYPWGPEAFAKAKKENKPILLSIGYSTCHWCHVMAHESFENPDIARLMNEYFVAIKVDREERPDIDQVYMTAVTALSGQGGWPLTAFLTPDQKPFYGGTYFPPEPKWGSPGFRQVLESIHSAWVNQPEQVSKSSASLLKFLQEQAKPTPAAEPLGRDVLTAAYSTFVANFDERYGGFGSHPKFPSAHNLSFLLRFSQGSAKSEAQAMAELTLQAMAKGGLYDHLGGGFHRYSTDERWHVPHFEKMLYDQATLVIAYLEAYQLTGLPAYARVAREVLDYVARDLRSPEGGFFSAEDADSLPVENGHEKKEGAFYIWSAKELDALLGKDAIVNKYYFGVEQEGNALSDPHGEFIGQNILFVARTVEQTAQFLNLEVAEVEAALTRSKQLLFLHRQRRPRPHLDDKVLTDWNGLMISAFALGGRVLDESKYTDIAEAAAKFVLSKLLKPDGELLHRYRDQEAAIRGTLTDYAFLTQGLLDLYPATLNVTYLTQAIALTHRQVTLFWDAAAGGFFMTAQNAEPLIIRQKEVYDGALPSGNSVAALNLLRLYALTLNSFWRDKADATLEAFAAPVRQHPAGYGQMLMALDYKLGPSREIVLSAKDMNPEVRTWWHFLMTGFFPRTEFLFYDLSAQGSASLVSLAPFVKDQPPLEGRPTVYVCENHVCQLPVQGLEKLRQVLMSPQP